MYLSKVTAILFSAILIFTFIPAGTIDQEPPEPQMGDVSHSLLAQHAAESYGLTTQQSDRVSQGAWDEDHCSLELYPPEGPLCFPGIPNGHHSWDPDTNLFWDEPAWWGDFGPGLSHAVDLYSRAVDAYESDRVKAAYLWLGRAMHMLGDASTPAHVLLDSHLPGDSDSYENWLSEDSHLHTRSWIIANPAGNEWRTGFRDLPTWEELTEDLQIQLDNASQVYGGRNSGSELWELGPTGIDVVIFRLMYLLAEEADNFDSDDVLGEKIHGDLADEVYLTEIRNTLFPILIRNSTALISYFQHTVMAEPAPKLLSPVDGEMVADNPPSLKWDPVGVKPTYEIEIDVDQDFIEPTITGETISTSFTPEVMLTNGEYFWRVRAYKTDWTSDWSEVWSFKVRWRVSMPVVVNLQ